MVQMLPLSEALMPQLIHLLPGHPLPAAPHSLCMRMQQTCCMSIDDNCCMLTGCTSAFRQHAHKMITKFTAQDPANVLMRAPCELKAWQVLQGKARKSRGQAFTFV